MQEEEDRSVKSTSLRHGKNHKGDNKEQDKKHTVVKHHQKKEKKESDDSDTDSSHSSDKEDKKKLKKKKKVRRPHSLVNKHHIDPSDLLDSKNHGLETPAPQSEKVTELVLSVVPGSIDSSTLSKLDSTSVQTDPFVDIPIEEPILISPLPPKAIVFSLEPTPAVHVPEFYAQLNFLDGFFRLNKITYWTNGGTLLGQIRNGMLIPWADCNSIALLQEDGQRCFAALKKAAKEQGYDLWNSVHGMKLRTTKSPVSTDIYFYSVSKEVYELSNERSRKQWPKDFFLVDELVGATPLPFGPLQLNAPKNAQRYLSTLYGNDYLTVARYSSFNHFLNAPRPYHSVKLG